MFLPCKSEYDKTLWVNLDNVDYYNPEIETIFFSRGNSLKIWDYGSPIEDYLKRTHKIGVKEIEEAEDRHGIKNVG